MNQSDQGSVEVAKRRSACCSFCGKVPEDEDSLIEGPGRDGFGAVSICRDCVELCSSIFEMQNQPMGEFDPAAVLTEDR